MALVSQARRWVIMIQRSRRGPYSAEQIHELLKSGIARHTDVAMLVTAAEESAPSWKFLWQFPEFDRRKKGEEERLAPPPTLLKKPSAPPVHPAYQGPERRKPLSPDLLQQMVASELPQELIEVAVGEATKAKLREAKKQNESSRRGRGEVSFPLLELTIDALFRKGKSFAQHVVIASLVVAAALLTYRWAPTLGKKTMAYFTRPPTAPTRQIAKVPSPAQEPTTSHEVHNRGASPGLLNDSVRAPEKTTPENHFAAAPAAPAPATDPATEARNRANLYNPYANPYLQRPRPSRFSEDNEVAEGAELK